MRTEEQAKLVREARFELGRCCRDKNATLNYIKRLIGRLIVLEERDYVLQMCKLYPDVLGELPIAKSTPLAETPLPAGIDPTVKAQPKKRGRKARLHGLFEEQGEGNWVRLYPNQAYRKEAAVRIFQNALLAPYMHGIDGEHIKGKRELRPVGYDEGIDILDKIERALG